MHNAIRRELRVAFSKKAQPPLFRVIKWVVFMAGTALISRTGFFRYWVIGLPLLSIMAHFVYRWKTRGWTRPWGGWSDLEAGQECVVGNNGARPPARLQRTARIQVERARAERDQNK